MTEMITKCPKCSTTFRVTEELLNSAKGSVRCGSCMMVFNGRAHLRKEAQSDDPSKSELDDLDQEIAALEEDEPIPTETSSVPAEEVDITDSLIDHEETDKEVEEVSEDESWVLDLLEEEGHDASQIGLVKKEGSELEADDSQTPESAAPESNNEPSTSNQNKLIDLIEPDTVEMTYKVKSRLWKNKIGLSLLIIVGALALGSQVAWLKYSELNKIEPYRTYYGKVCAVIGCVLPELTDKSKIKTSNLIVRSHPEKQNALLVEVLVQNSALFEQPFPRLTLQFKDLKNIVVARRTFKPEDYLAGEVANLTLMPIKQPIRIQMELVDPGEGAVSYDMNIGP